MIISASFSKPVSNIREILGRDYLRIKVKAINKDGKTSWFFEGFTEKQAFHASKTEAELNEFIEKNAGITFKNAVIRTDKEEITILANKKGKIKRLVNKNLSTATKLIKNLQSPEKQKNYLLQEGKPVPFMVLLGIMNADGKVISSKYDKFRQINRFLEFIDDILPEVIKQKAENNEKECPLRIEDFGCGKSYLTFAVHYYLTEIKKLDVEIIGLDLKQDVIDYCNKITKELGLKGLKFDVGNISDYNYENNPDMVITLHACDTATDFALDYAIKHNCKAILSVPCCQHEINSQLNENLKNWKKESKIPENFLPILKYGILKERFSALLTDALRAEILEKNGYSTQILEFIDMEHTPKNLLIRAVKKSLSDKRKQNDDKNSSDTINSVLTTLEISQKLNELLKN